MSTYNLRNNTLSSNNENMPPSSFGGKENAPGIKPFASKPTNQMPNKSSFQVHEPGTKSAFDFGGKPPTHGRMTRSKTRRQALQNITTSNNGQNIQQRPPLNQKPKFKPPTSFSAFNQSPPANDIEMATPEPMDTDMTDLNLSPKVDIRDQHDPQCAVDYIKDIFEHFKRTEMQHAPNNSYMKAQPDISVKMRAILVDWLVDVHHKFNLCSETLYLTINIIDRFLSHKVVKRSKLQLVGVTAMLLASKYEDIFSPEVADFVYISDKAYSHDEILVMERMMLRTLSFNLTVPTLFPFIRRFLRVADACDQTRHLAFYFAEMALLNYHMLRFPPSMIASACVYMALRMTRPEEPWSSVMKHYANYGVDELTEASDVLFTFAKNIERSKLQATRVKYNSSKRGQVTSIVARISGF
eukprot:gb/GECH01003708.1/.p1 GENE.gb/GECH01003708.1/~~gb/GECH01003708.1/.p1  ORF type:complete len:412 (+),score=80.67 gb/GECH01003708.1/:1-1236(+)